MSAPQPTGGEPNNALRLAQLASVLRPAFRCPTVPDPLRELFRTVRDAANGGNGSTAANDGTDVDAVEAALRCVIMLRNALDAARVPQAPPGAAPIEAHDSDPEIGLHLALFGVESLLARLGWTPQACG